MNCLFGISPTGLITKAFVGYFHLNLEFVMFLFSHFLRYRKRIHTTFSVVHFTLLISCKTQDRSTSLVKVSLFHRIFVQSQQLKSQYTILQHYLVIPCLMQSIILNEKRPLPLAQISERQEC